MAGTRRSAGGARPRRCSRRPSWCEAWQAEWVLLDGYLAGLADDDLDRDLDGTPLWQTMAHLVNHGTQHRSEAAALLTAFGLSPGDLDLIDFAEQAAAG